MQPNLLKLSEHLNKHPAEQTGSENIIQSNTALVLHHVAWRGMYFFSVLILNIIIARLFAAEKSGRIFYIVNNLSLILLIAGLSLESGMGYYLAMGKISGRAMALLGLRWALPASVLAVMLWWLLLHLTHSVYLQNSLFMPISFLFIAGIQLTSYFTALFYAQKEFVVPNKILLVTNLLLIGVLLAGQSAGSVRAHFFELYFGCFFIQGLLMTVFFLTTQAPATGRSAENFRGKIFQYSLTALVANVIYFLVNRIDYWFVEYYCSAKDFGNYVQASKLGQMLLIVPGILGATLFPLFSRKSASPIGALPSLIRMLLWVNILTCLLIAFSGWFLFPFIFGPSFNSMYQLFLLLVPGILGFTMNYPLAAWFSAADQIAVNIKGALVALLIVLTGDFLLLPRLGVPAASVISSAGYLAYFFYTYHIYRKKNPIAFADLLILRKADIALVRLGINKFFGSGDEASSNPPL